MKSQIRKPKWRKFALLLLGISLLQFPVIAPAQQTGIARRFFAADYEKKLAAIVEADNSLSWQIPIRDIHDAQKLPAGGWLLQTSFFEVVELDTQGNEVWRYDAGQTDSGARVEIHAFRRLPDGLTMIAESGTSRILLVDREKKVVKSIPLKVEKADPHRDTRLVRPTPTGTFLVAHESQRMVREYARDGAVVWEFEVGSQLYSAVRLENGNTLIGTGDGNRVLEVSPTKEIVWELKSEEIPGVKLGWITMVDRLANGNTWIVNCHAGPDQPQLLEVSPDKKVVWSFHDFKRFGNSLPVAFPLE
ncbi:MAG: PQQ-binding-like beta-propeller repeat protein [Planctomycetaceae bacterium]|nr:PQQ-binding-like beta-propeller repeat protein [Planctomycetaceae bacterium]